MTFNQCPLDLASRVLTYFNRASTDINLSIHHPNCNKNYPCYLRIFLLIHMIKHKISTVHSLLCQGCQVSRHWTNPLNKWMLLLTSQKQQIFLIFNLGWIIFGHHFASQILDNNTCCVKCTMTATDQLFDKITIKYLNRAQPSSVLINFTYLTDIKFALWLPLFHSSYSWAMLLMSGRITPSSPLQLCFLFIQFS